MQLFVFFLLGVVPLECQAQVTGRFHWDWHWPSVNCAADPKHKKHLGDHQVMFTYLCIDTWQQKHVHYMHWWWHCLLCILILHRARIPPNRSLVNGREIPTIPSSSPPRNSRIHFCEIHTSRYQSLGIANVCSNNMWPKTAYAIPFN